MGKRNKKHLTVVSFDEEIVTKHSADKVIADVEGVGQINSNGFCKNESINYSSSKKKTKRKKSNIPVSEQTTNFDNNEIDTETKVKRIKAEANDNIDLVSETNESEGKIKRKRKKQTIQTNQEPVETDDTTVENGNIKKGKSKQIKTETNDKLITKDNSDLISETNESEGKVKLKTKNQTIQADEEPAETDDTTVENGNVKKGESIRAQKRKKHLKLLEDKRLKVELTTQQSALNYLSKWKHCRSEWKFEKLKQIWLQQNLFDTTKIPKEFWETVIEYFSGSKGFIRNVILRDALKIIDKEENTEEENTDENYVIVLQRAREIVQNLQE